MSKNRSLMGLPAAISLLMFGCATIDSGETAALINAESVMDAPMLPAKIPMPVKTIEIYDAMQKKRVEADVLSLSADDIRKRLTTTQTLIAIQKRDSSGSLTYLGSGGKVSRGSYRVTFDYANYTNQEVSFGGSTSNAAIGRIGVGLRITADLDTFSNNVDLSGLFPIGLAAKDGKVSGRLSFEVYGMSNDKVALAIPSNSILDESSIQKSFEAAATVRVLFGLPETKLEPYLIGVANIKPVDASAALAAAASKLTQ